MHREDTANLITYLSDNLKIFTCLIPLDDQPIVIFNRVQDPSPLIQNNFSSDQQNRANYLNNERNTALQPLFNSLYSAAAKRYFATIILSPNELDSFRAFLPVIDNFYHFQLYVRNKQRAREHRNQFNYGYEENKPEAYAVPQRAANPKKGTQFRLKKNHQNVSYHLMRCRMSCGYMSWSTPKLKKSSINHPSIKLTHQLFVVN